MGHAAPSLAIAAQQIFDGSDMRGPGSVRISQGRIEDIRFGSAQVQGSIQLPAEAILAPGLIDIQVNGGGGVLLNDQPTEDGVRRIVEAHRRGGTTGGLPTLLPIVARLSSDWRQSLTPVWRSPACSDFIWKDRP